MSDEIQDNEWIRPGQITYKPRQEPQVDKAVSAITGKKIYVNNQTLLALVKKWRSQKTDENAFDNFFQDPLKVQELKEVFK